MRLVFVPIVLDADGGDCEGVLACREGRLVAVLCRLGPLHDDHAGRWFVEAVFGEAVLPGGETFASLDEAGAWFDPD